MGRADLIETLSGQLTAASVAATLVALVGMGGLGKTSLAAALAHYLRDHVADGVLWVNVTTSDPMNTLALWARAYGYDFSGLTDVESRGTAVRSILADKQALIVLDNVESSAAAKPLLLGGPDCAVVITTRNLDSAAALDAHPVLLAELSPESSRDLLVHILGEERVLATADEAAAAAQIGHLLHHLPLAVGIAAQRLKSRPRMRLSGMARRLQDTQQRLGLEISDSAVRSSFRVSWDGLDTPLRHLFSCMAVFAARSFTPQAIATTADRDLLDIEQSDYNTAWERLEQALPLLYQLENGSGIAQNIFKDMCYTIRANLPKQNRFLRKHGNFKMNWVMWQKKQKQPGCLPEFILKLTVR